MRPQSPARAMWRAGELGDQERSGSRVYRELGLERIDADGPQRSPEPVPLCGPEAVLHPAARVADQHLHGAELRLGAVEQARRSGGIDEIGLERLGPPPGCADRLDQP
jgi:hypothetical protein